MILPDILEDIGHLQALPERNAELHQGRALPIDGRGIVAEEFGQQLAHDPRDVIAIAPQIGQIGHAVQRLGVLIMRHAAGHDRHATRERGPLARIKAVGHADHRRDIGDQIPLGPAGRGREPRQQRRRETRRIRPALDHLDEALGIFTLGPGRHGLVIFYGVGDAAQQVGVPDHPAERPRQRGDGQGKGARHLLQDFILIGRVIKPGLAGGPGLHRHAVFVGMIRHWEKQRGGALLCVMACCRGRRFHAPRP